MTEMIEMIEEKNMKIIKKMSEIELVMIKDTKGYANNYVSLNKILTSLFPKLRKNNMHLYNRILSDSLVTTVVDLESGESIESNFKFVDGDEVTGSSATQNYGAKITYARRYNLGCLFNLIIDEDQDDVGEPQMTKKQTYNNQTYGNQSNNLNEKINIEDTEFNRLVDLVNSGHEISDLKLLEQYEKIIKNNYKQVYVSFKNKVSDYLKKNSQRRSALEEVPF